MDFFRKKEIEGRTAEEWFELGLEEQDPEKRLEYFSKGLKLDPKNAAAWNNKGKDLHKLGRYEEALRYYDKALEIDPVSEEARTNKKDTEMILRIRRMIQ